MDTMQIIAQAVGILAMGFMIFSYQMKTHRAVLIFQLVGAVLFAINFWLLGATMGCIMNSISAIRAVIFLNAAKLRANHPGWLAGFLVTYLDSYVLSFTVLGTKPTPLNLIMELLPVIGMIAATLSFRLANAGAIRKFGLISSPCWLIYNIYTFSLGAIICEVLSLSSIIIGIRRLDRKK